MLDGYGPIPPSMVRRLVADGAESFHRVLVDPRDGAPLEIGRASYRLTKGMRQWLRLRDGRCPFPGCNNPSLDNEADHLLAWADGGTTGITNLGQPCRKHHGLKHASGWTPSGASKDTPPAGPPPQGATIPANSRTGNHPTGHPGSRPPGRSRTHFWIQACPRSPAGTPTWTCRRNLAGIPTWTCHRTPAGIPTWTCPTTRSRTGTASCPNTSGPPRAEPIRAGQDPQTTHA